MSPTVWLFVGLLILANAFYVAAEFGAVGVRRSRVRRLSEDGHPLARRLWPHVEHPTGLYRYVAVSQVGITVASLVLGAVGESVAAVSLAPHLGSLFGLEPGNAANTAAVIVLVLLTSTQVVLGELIPKTLALRYPTEVALATVLPMRWSLVAFKPFIALLNGSATAVLRLAGASMTGHRHLHSPDEMALLFAESRDGGLLEPDEQQRLHKALRLSRVTARDLMVPLDKLTMIDVDAPWTEILKVVSASPFSRLPAYRGTREQVVGVLRVKDLVHRFVADGSPDAITSLLRPFVTVTVALPGDRVIALLRERRAHQAMVTDERGVVTGLITIQDVLAQFLGPGVKAT
ncbi:MAG TPA: hemolysin family protein [Vicinamibacterales bacterium]|nr:hemolysin family protein [Vicinamibacterales bacterium]